MEDFSSLPGTVPRTLLLMLGEDTAYASKNAARLLGIAKQAQDPAAKLEALWDAGHVIHLLRAELAKVRRDFADHCANLNLAQSSPRYQRWSGHLTDAFRRTRYALWLIDDAKADIAEAEDAAAADEIAHAADHVRFLRRALVRLFFDAWKVRV